MNTITMEKVLMETNITDMSVFGPAAARSAESNQGVWRLIDYETEDGMTGKLLFGRQGESLPPLSLSLKVKGWFRIVLGLAVEDGLGTWVLPAIKLKLNQDPCFSEIATQGPFFWLNIKEIVWREVYLENETLTISKRSDIKSGLAYLKLIPLTDAEICSRKVRQPESNPYLIATNDSYAAYSSLEELLEKIYSLRESAVKKLFFGFANGDLCYYMKTKVGNRFEDFDLASIDFPRKIDRLNYEAIIRLGRSCDVIGEVRKFTRSLGMEFHASVRMEAFAAMPPYECFSSSFFKNNPKWHCRDHDGRKIDRVSYAFPEVQEHMLALFREMIECGIDGLNLIFTRGMPMMLYEAPLLDGFQAKYGLNALELPENDPRYLSFRASALTGFMQKVRALCDSYSEKSIQLSAVVPANKSVNAFFGIDLESWIDKGLLDLLCPDMSLQTMDHDESPENIDLDYFQTVIRGSRCQLIPRLPSYHQLISEAQYPEKFRSVFNRMRTDQVHGMLLWDAAHDFSADPRVWACVRDFGKFDSEKLPKIKPFKTLGTFVMDKYPAHMAF